MTLVNKVKASLVITTILIIGAVVLLNGNGNSTNVNSLNSHNDKIVVEINTSGGRPSGISITPIVDSQTWKPIVWKRKTKWRHTFIVRKGAPLRIITYQLESGELSCKMWVNNAHAVSTYEEIFVQGLLVCDRKL